MDLMFLFWSISVGIICGAGLAEVAVICSILVSVLIVVLDKLPVARVPLILTINAVSEEGAKQGIIEVIETQCRYYKIKSQTIAGESLNLVFEVRTDQELTLTELLSHEKAVRSVSLLSHDGEVTY